MPVYPVQPLEPGTPGALIEEEYQYEFRGLLFGAGTDFITEKVSGLLGGATARDQDTDKDYEHGAHPGTLLYGKRILSFDIHIRGAGGADVESKLEAARTAFQVPRIRYSKRLDPFLFRRPGQPDKVLYVRCTKRDFDSDYKVARGLASGSVELVAPDPIIRGWETRGTSLALAAGDVAGQVVATNLGSFVDGSKPYLEINGPAKNPIVENETDDERSIRLQVDLAAGDAVRIDVETRIVEVRRGPAGPWVKDYSIVRTDNQWWNMLPGPNVINYNRTGSTGGSLLILNWRDTWS